MEKQLSSIKSIKTGSKSLKMIDFFTRLSPDAERLINVIKEKEKNFDTKKRVCIKSGKEVFKTSFKFASTIYNGEITLEEAKKGQYNMLKQPEDLEEHNPTNLDRINSRKETLINAEELYNNRENVIKAFKNAVFPFKDWFYQKEESNVADETLPDWVKADKKRFDRLITLKCSKMKINLIYQEGVVIVLMLTVHTDWFNT